jgi:hypothetical protein
MDEETLMCLDHWRSACQGAVELREALSASGTRFPRCDGHWDKRLQEQQRLNRDYPDSPTPPAWFDPTYAGERWDEDY